MVQTRTANKAQHFVQMGALALLVIGWGQNAMAAKETLKIVALGDSLTAGYGVAPGDAFPVQLQKALIERGEKVEIINAGVSGDTASAGRDRLDWALPADADAVIVELGANDGLRGIDPKVTRTLLDDLLMQLKARKLPVLFTGMKAPRNWGEAYATTFDAMFADLAAKHGALFYPFFLDGVVVDPALNQPDGIHPNPKGVAEIVRRITPKVQELIVQVRAGTR